MFEKLFNNLPLKIKKAVLAELYALQLSDAFREKTPAERIDEYVANGCVGDCDTSGFSREDFERLASLTPIR